MSKQSHMQRIIQSEVPDTKAAELLSRSVVSAPSEPVHPKEMTLAAKIAHYRTLEEKGL